MIKEYSKNNQLKKYLLAMIVFILSWWLDFGLISIIILLVTITLAIKLTFSKISSIQSFLASWAIFVSYNCMFGAIFWVLKIKMSYTMIFIVLFLAFMLSLVLLHKQKPAININTLKLNKYSKIKLGIIIMAASLLFGSYIIKINTSYPLQLFMYGGDNLSHLEHTLTVQDNKGYLYDKAENIKDKLTVSHAGYPQGLHLNYSIAIQSSSKLFNLDNKLNLIKFVMFGFIGTYFILFIAILEIISQLVGKQDFWSTLASGLFAIIIIFGQLITSFLYGAQVEIFDLLLLICQVIILIHALNYYRNSNKIKTASLIIMASFINVGILFGWLFIGPVSILLTAASFLLIFKNEALKLAKLKFNSTFIITGFLMFCSISLAMIQYWVQHKFGIKQNSINEPGFIDGNLLPLVVVSITFLGYTIISKFKLNQIISLVFLLGLLFTLAIGTYQYFSIGGFRYYFFKSSHLPIIFGEIILASTLIGLIKIKDHNKSKIIGSLVLIFALMFNSLYRLSGSYILGKLKPLESGNINLLERSLEQRQRLISLGSCNKVEDFLITRLSQISSRTNDSFSQSFSFGILGNSDEAMDNALIGYNKQNLIAIADSIEAKEAEAKAGIVNINLNETNKPGKADCPGALY